MTFSLQIHACTELTFFRSHT